MSAHRATVVLRPEARGDIRAIFIYSAQQWDTAQADTYLEAIYRALSTLEERPFIGRPRDNIRPGLRSYRVEQHLIYYDFNADTVMVFRILHANMDISQHLETL